MNLRPASVEELARSLREASQSTTRIGSVDLSSLSCILEHTPEDMTVTVEAGATLANLQRTLAARGQWLPIDPPRPGRLTLAAMLDSNASGPRRAGFGTIRDYLIGLRVALADGRLVRSGGKVVKNVAGYDLMKLFIGARGTLGVIVEATFKLLPLPGAEFFVQARCESLESAERLIAAVLDSELTPTVFDLHNLDPSLERERLVPPHPGPLPKERESGTPLVEKPQTLQIADELPVILPLPLGGGEGRGEGEPHAGGSASTLQRFNTSTLTLTLGFSGARAAVDWQLTLARSLGFTAPATLHYEASFHAPDLPPPHRRSVLPSRLVENLRSLGDVPFVSRVANGIIHHRGAPQSERLAPARREPAGQQHAELELGAPSDLPRKLLERVKATFDPNGVFPVLPW
ncbi:MAG TPA: FAD-binding oxidoreductase [Verrucomicrobiae bacterium]|nr:FAD-binding oxidoreductase [Verrucomicrobiae bacterium]